jgi:hypothetical protein
VCAEENSKPVGRRINTYRYKKKTAYYVKTVGFIISKWYMVAYKVFSSMLLQREQPYAEERVVD